jgi:hypothetical protein
VTASEPGIRSAAQELIEELMGSVVTIDFLLRALMELPAEVLPGDGGSEGVREMLIASACRGVEPVGEEGCRAATKLLRDVIDQIADDVDAARQLSMAAEQRPC